MNKCHFLGKVTEDPEVYLENGVPVVNFEIELEEFRKDGNGEKRRSVTYIGLEAWHTAATTIEKYAPSGSIVAIEGVARNTDCGDTYFRVTNFKILNQ
jgi:single-stranded DNA-binding protein